VSELAPTTTTKDHTNHCRGTSLVHQGYHSCRYTTLATGSFHSFGNDTGQSSRRRSNHEGLHTHTTMSNLDQWRVPPVGRARRTCINAKRENWEWCRRLSADAKPRKSCKEGQCNQFFWQQKQERKRLGIGVQVDSQKLKIAEEDLEMILPRLVF